MVERFNAKTRRFLAFLFDICAVGLAFTGAFALRFDFQIPEEHLQLMWGALPWVLGIQTVVFVGLGLYRGVWAFASIRDLFLIGRAVLLAVLCTLAYVAMSENRFQGWPRSVFLLDPFLLVMILGGGRFLYRIGREMAWGPQRQWQRVLVIGAGHTANMLAREYSVNPGQRVKVLGFLDDQPQMVGMKIQGVSVLGPIHTLPHWVKRLKPSEVVIAIPSLSGVRVKEILRDLSDLNTPCRIIPPIRDAISGAVELSQLRGVEVEDLLRRDVVEVDNSGIQTFLSGQTALITGAGGSIGSELCRQVLKFKPNKLVLFERSEFNLYRIECELRERLSREAHAPELVFVIGDVLDERRLDSVLREHRPQVVLHAAAYKHVPMMEENVSECLRNNVVGTQRTVLACAKADVETFVLVSTDKAVRPTNVMGATKRMAELVSQAVGRENRMKTIAVRFGNVLDSEGSVLPRFREQIASGGPVTVTDPNVERYFMTIPEAALLVLQAACLGTGGEVFVLDMGEPVRIRELAEELIRLSGLRPGSDIEIVYTGLRPGEKLYEELMIDADRMEKTKHTKILMSAHEHGTRLPESWMAQVNSFAEGRDVPEREALLEWIQAWVPEYHPESNLDESGSGLDSDGESAVGAQVEASPRVN